MKNGIARKEKMPMPEVICWNPTASGRPSYSSVASADKPMENATGTPSNRNSVNEKQRINNGIVMIFLAPGWFYFFAFGECDDVFDGKHHNEDARNRRGNIAPPFGNPQGGQAVAPYGLGQRGAVIGHGGAEQQHQRVNQIF